MKKLSLKNSNTLTVDEAFEDFKGHCRVKNLSGETYTDAELDVLLKKPNLKTCGFSEYKI